MSPEDKMTELAATITWFIENLPALTDELDRALFGMTEAEFFASGPDKH